MGAAPIPENEAVRLAALREYGILDTEPDPAFDAFALLASQICDVPVALVTLIDESRQWCKANVGLPGLVDTARDATFCAHAIGSENLLEVSDTTLDARFYDNPAVIGDPHIRFYAGMPLVDTRGNSLGTLCVLDYGARALTERQRTALRSLASSVSALIEARRGVSPRALRQLALLSGALEYASEPFMILRNRHESEAPTIEYANRAFSDLFGYAVTDLVGKRSDILNGRRTDERKLAAVRAAAAFGEPACEMIYLYTQRGSARLIEFRDRSIDDGHRIACLRDQTRIVATQEALATSNLRLNALLANNTDPVFTLDEYGSCLDVNRAAIERFGYAREDLLGFGYLRMASNGLFAESDLFPRNIREGRSFEFTAEYRSADGALHRVLSKAIPIVVRGQTVGAYVISRDVTEASYLETIVRAQAKRTHALCLIAGTNGQSDEHQIDAILGLALVAFDMQLGFVGELVGESIRLRNVAGTTISQIGTVFPLERTFARRTIACGDVFAIDDIFDPSNSWEGVDVHPGWHGYIAAPLTIDGNVEGVAGFYSRRAVQFDEFDRDFMRLVAALISAAAERQLQKRRLDRIAELDPLTGLVNRRKFQDDLAAVIERVRSQGGSFAVHLVDLENFKAINARFGLEVGDATLREVAARLTAAAGDADVVARLGGDEFVFLQATLGDASDVEAARSRLLAILSRPYTAPSGPFMLGASVRASLFPDDGTDVTTLLCSADAALDRT